MTSNDDGSIRDIEIALTDALRTTLEIIMASGLAKPDVFERVFAHQFAFQRDGYLAKDMPAAAAVMESLRLWVLDRDREAHRAMLRTMLQATPGESA